jgi:hypothetical protein
MGLFSKTINDEEWFRQVDPLYRTALPFIVSLDEAMEEESLENQFVAIQNGLNRLPIVAEAIKRIPTPTSSEARQAKKNLESAMKEYIDGMKQGAIFFKDLGGGPGERLQSGGVARRAASARLTFSKSFFENLIDSGHKHMAQASTYLSK